MFSLLGLALISGSRLKGEVCAICSEQRGPSNSWHQGQKSAAHLRGPGKFSEPAFSPIHLHTCSLASPRHVNVHSVPIYKLTPP